MGRVAKYKKQKEFKNPQDDPELKKKFDAVPSNSKKNALPRKLRTLITEQEKFKNNLSNKVKNSDDADIKKKRYDESDIRPGESLAAYKKRLLSAARSDLTKAFKESSHSREKKKQRLKERKDKLKEKQKLKKQEKREDAPDFNQKVDHVKFGEVVQTVPDISVVPRPLNKPRVTPTEGRSAAEQRLFDLDRERVCVCSEAGEELERDQGGSGEAEANVQV